MTGLRPVRDVLAWFAYRRVCRRVRTNLAR